MKDFINFEPGILCNKGCCFMACRGLTLSPIKDLLVITHGPIGCSYFSWKLENSSHSFSTNMSEEDIIFGGEKKLKTAIDEAIAEFFPKAVAVCSTCAVALIGDDVERICREAQSKHKIPIYSFTCEGFKNIHGFELANKKIVEEIYGTKKSRLRKYPINIIGEFFTGRNRREIEKLFNIIGYDIVSVLFGESSIDELRSAQDARVVVQGSGKPIFGYENNVKKHYNMDCVNVNFFGIANTSQSLLNISRYFKEDELINRTELIINDNVNRVKKKLKTCEEIFKGYKAVVYNDGFKGRQIYDILQELNIKVEITNKDNIYQDTIFELYNPEGELYISNLFNCVDHDFQYAGFEGIIQFAKDLKMEIDLLELEKNIKDLKLESGLMEYNKNAKDFKAYTKVG